MNWAQHWMHKTTSTILVNIGFLEDCVNLQIPVDLVCKSENWITASGVLATITKRQYVVSSDQTLAEHISSKENPLIYWHLLQSKEFDPVIPLKTERAAVIAVQSHQLSLPGIRIRWGGSISLMCGEFLGDAKAGDVDWPSEEEKIDQELSVVSEPY
jgi:hypothetical protein